MTLADPLALFLAHADTRPAAAAVIEGDRVVSYGELARLAARIAAAAAGVAPHPRVLVAAPAGANAYAAMMGTLMAGGFYAPVNLEAPAAKRQRVAQAFGPQLVVVADGAEPPEGLGVPVVRVEDLDGPGLAQPRPPHDLAYVMFTSGSTGQPKGVMIPRSALAHYVAWVLRDMAITPEDRWSQHPNIAFDLSVLDIYGALCGGATLVPLKGAERRLAPALAIRRERLTIWDSVPSVVNLMRQAGQLNRDFLASLRLMTFCGEPLLPEHLDGIFAARPDLLVHNTYGPTEATVSCTLLPLTAADYRPACGPSVAIGEAIDGMGLHLVGGTTPDEGELVITGPQLARGYWRDESATAAAFRKLATPQGDLPAYFTGDWARRRDGHVFFATRIDFQVKLGGQRVELAEIEAAIRRCGIATAVALVQDGRLHAVIEGKKVDEDALLDKLAGQLEKNLLPTVFHYVDALPRNANDKIDARALADALGRGDIP